MRLPRTITAAALCAAATLAATLTANTATASINDDFEASTTDGCGVVNFIDHGPGVPGNSESNDDYLVIHDYCTDGHGVRAWASIDGIPLGSKYNGNGLAGDPVIWDPFKDFDGNVNAGDTVWLRVCLVDGSADTSGSRCDEQSRVSRDG